MLGWKAKAGYLRYRPANEPDDKINISDVVITDEMYFFLHEYIEPRDVIQYEYSGPSDAYYWLRSLLGNRVASPFSWMDPNVFYSTKIDYNNPAGLEMVSALQGIKFSSPNLYDILLNTDVNLYPLIIVPPLSVLIYHGRLYTINGDVATRVNGSAIGNNYYYPLWSSNKDASHNLLCYKGSEKKEDLVNIENYSVIKIEWYRRWRLINVRIEEMARTNKDAYTLGMGTLFGYHYSKPNINIPDNPYEPGGSSGEGGGGGSFDKDSDLIPDSSLPSISAANTGFTRIYNPTLAQVQDLARYLWTDESVIGTIWNHIKQYFESPMEAILGFNLVPVPVPNGGVEDFALMYIKTGVMMNTAANQFVDRDCGTFELKPYYGSALDYSPHTKVSCFLPYIGTVQLNTDEVMGTTLQVKYRVDICSGSCVAKIFVNGSCLYQYSGHCAINIPISASDFSSYVSSAISVAKLAIGAATGAGMAAAASVLSDPVQQTNQVVTRTTTTTETARNPLSGRQITTGTRSIVETTERPADVSSTQASFDGLTPSNISNTVGQIMGSKPHVEHSGSFSGNTGYLGVRRPFLIIERPNMCMPEQYQQFNGFPAMITMPLSECTGFTQVQQVQLTGMEATNPEQSEILQMLKTGVIL